MNLGVDIDDVIYPWFDVAHEVCTFYGIDNGRVPSSWHCWEDYGCTEDEWIEAIENATRTGWLYQAGDPIPGAITALHALKEAGHKIHLITARGFFRYPWAIKRETVHWLHEWDIPYDSLTFTQDKSLYRMDLFIDDSIKNVADIRMAGVPCFLADAPHNQDIEDEQRVSGLAEFASIILGTEVAA